MTTTLHSACKTRLVFPILALGLLLFLPGCKRQELATEPEHLLAAQQKRAESFSGEATNLRPLAKAAKRAAGR